MALTDEERVAVDAACDAGAIEDRERGRFAAWQRRGDLSRLDRQLLATATHLPRASGERSTPPKSLAEARAALLASPEAMRGLNAAAGREGLDSLTYARERLSRGEA